MPYVTGRDVDESEYALRFVGEHRLHHDLLQGQRGQVQSG